MSILIKISAICFLAALVTSQENDTVLLDESQQAIDRNSRIVGGQIVADRTNFPFQVSLRTVSNNSPFCGGAIVHSQHVVTAARCVVDTGGNEVAASTIQAVVGDLITTITTNNTVVERIAHIFVHNAFNNNTHQNDVAVLRLQNNLTFNAYIAAIQLAQATPLPGVFGTVSGWGTIFLGGPPSQSLRYAQVTTVAAATCAAQTQTSILTGMICAGNYRLGSCEGDYGAPLVWNNQLLGLVSVPACGSIDYPGIYTEIAVHHTWISNQFSEDTSSTLSFSIFLTSFSVFLSILMHKI